MIDDNQDAGLSASSRNFSGSFTMPRVSCRRSSQGDLGGRRQALSRQTSRWERTFTILGHRVTPDADLAVLSGSTTRRDLAERLNELERKYDLAPDSPFQ